MIELELTALGKHNLKLELAMYSIRLFNVVANILKDIQKLASNKSSNTKPYGILREILKRFLYIMGTVKN